MLLLLLTGCMFSVADESPVPEPDVAVPTPEALPPADAAAAEDAQVACDVTARVAHAEPEGAPVRAVLTGDVTGRIGSDAELHLTASSGNWVHADTAEMPEHGPQPTGWVFGELLTTTLRVPGVRLHAEPNRASEANVVDEASRVWVEKCSGSWLYVTVGGSFEGWVHPEDHCPSTLVDCTR